MSVENKACLKLQKKKKETAPKNETASLNCSQKHMLEQELLLHDHWKDVQSEAMLSLICSACDGPPGSSAVRQRLELLAAAWLSTTRHALKPETLSFREHSPSFFF